MTPEHPIMTPQDADTIKGLREVLEFYRDNWTMPPIGPREDPQPKSALLRDQGERASKALAALALAPPPVRGEEDHMVSRDHAHAGSSVLDEADEAYGIGKRDGWDAAIQRVDELTGGDGEYRFCTNGDPERHTPDATTMLARIVERFEAPPIPPGVGEAREALEKCRDKFHEYATLHADKLTPEGNTKALANIRMMEVCRDALAALTVPTTQEGGGS